ncbi:S8 family serine peptidase [Paenibacillus sp. IB182496]|uniref:S8 family serine peptidase n=1 Tax=Paenibacillus sabuli TaxID=2772509 RepID=A0A927BU12_9BACL|nr:S8 family serine peptidase [Paenibacillus sabuli]MBD2845871.1 S8 family serine peptidase [Paenibacillus sabuli]
MTKYNRQQPNCKDRTAGKAKTNARLLLCVLLACALVLPSCSNLIAAPSPVQVRTGPPSEIGLTDSWLLKWQDSAHPTTLPNTQLLRRQPAAGIEVVKPARGADAQAWLEELLALPEVEYVHPNGKVELLTATSDESAPDDPELAKQSYLKLIGASDAWKVAHDQTELTVAIVDTGVDLQHSDLKANLVAGTNLVKPGADPQDDNGHGTNVAGVLAAVGNNGQGVAGLLWNANIMPVKALDADGYGDEERLGEGILYAIEHGAKIVLLSVGLYRHSPYMRDIAEYAESSGVLLVAATGNDGLKHGDKAAVKYPAGYPSVLAVGGAKPSGEPEPRANPGPEVDVIAPWDVYTTKLGGGYKTQEGTSMAAPQAAAAAALVWAKYPNLKPYQVRALLRQTAEDVGQDGWDEAAGYGLLQVGEALTASYRPDAYEPNETKAQARMLPMYTKLSAQLNTGKEKDWFKFKVPYDGTVTLLFQGLTSPGQPMPPVNLIRHDADGGTAAVNVKTGSRKVQWKLSAGTYHVELQLDDSSSTHVLPYLLTSDFSIAPDPYESNDDNIEAFTLPPQSQTITGNFHQSGDRDWFAITFEQGGTLDAKLETDTVRIDPAFAIGRAGGRMVEFDEYGDGQTEQTDDSTSITVTPGKYFIRVHNAAASDASPVAGTYTLTLALQTVYEDPNEPNDRAYEATSVRVDTDYVGVIDGSDDEDWYQLRLQQESIVSISLDDIPSGRTMTMRGYDRTQQELFTVQSQSGKDRLTTNRRLKAGTYYIRATANSAFTHQHYHFSVKVQPLVAGFVDIDQHWAREAIVSLAGAGIVSGYGEYRFEPGRSITRAEAVAVLVKAFRIESAGSQPGAFKDVQSGHWAYSAVMRAVSAGWVKGYPDGTFAPDDPVTRAEMAAMFGAALRLQGSTPLLRPFSDVSVEHWAAPMLLTLKQAGWISGYRDNDFKPGQSASRAEFATLVYRAL